MTVHIDELVTDIVADTPGNAGPAAGSAAPPPWKELERQRVLRARLLRDRLRTLAEGTRD